MLLLTQISFSQKKWATNLGIEGGTDGMFGLAGVSQLKQADNPLINSDLDRQYAVSADLYLEFLKLEKRKNEVYGSIKPTFGIKTKLEWTFFRADNSKNNGGEYLALNYINIPVLFEYCLGYHQGVTRASYTPGTNTYNGRQNSDGSVTVTESSTAGTHYAGGNRTSWGSFIYFGPQVSYLFKSFNSNGDLIKDQNFRNNYLGLTGGFTFCFYRVNLDFSYQKGLTSIYNGKNITVDGFMCRLGINFGKRLYND